MTFWKKRKNKFEFFKEDYSDNQGDSQQEVATIYRRQDVILKKLDIQERLIQKQSRQIEGLLEALNNINTALESNNIVLEELIKSKKNGPDFLLN
jgi:hypothetical protein